jgi:protein-ribulosamine 3-kinase
VQRAHARCRAQEPGFEKRAKLYKLYHYLNHFNMFGGGYYGTALALLQELTA